MEKRICTIEGCEKRVEAKGLCKMHYTRKRREIFEGIVNLCTEPGCESIVEARMLCSMHYQEARRREKGMKPMFVFSIVNGVKSYELYVSSARKIHEANAKIQRKLSK